MFVANEGTVYSVLPFDSTYDYVFTEALCEEGTIGFLFREQKYHAVTFRSGQWTPSDPVEFIQYYDAQQLEWANAGASMPWLRRFAFLRLFVEICGTDRERFSHFY